MMTVRWWGEKRTMKEAGGNKDPMCEREIGTVERAFGLKCMKQHKKGFSSPRMTCLEWSGNCLERLVSFV